jgi:16S rRNA (guanine527-N7)-methyltransferase
VELGSKEWKKFITDGAGDMGVQISASDVNQFAIHGIELLHWTRKINLTSITDPYEVGIKHFLDSIAPFLMIPPGASMLDIGSGGGFPGIPLKILIPSLTVTLIDASRKKVSFLKHIIRTLQLDNIDALHIRAEDLARSPSENDILFHRPFDVIISRALSALDNFITLALPLLAKNGIIIAFKGNVGADEIESVRLRLKRILDGTQITKNNFSLLVKKYVLPYIGLERSLISLRI